MYVADVVDVPQLPRCGAGAGVGWGMLKFLVDVPHLPGCGAGAGVGHVNVPCTLHALLMFLPQLPGCGAGAGVGWGMLTFLVRCTRC